MLEAHGQILASEPATVSRANELLHLSRAVVGRLQAGNCTFAPVFAHFSRGPYARGRFVRLHQHEELQIQATISGRFSFTTPDRRVELEPGAACVIAAGQPHEWRCLRSGVLLGMLLNCEYDRSPSFTEMSEPLPRDSPTLVYDPASTACLRDMVRHATEPHRPFATERVGFALGQWMIAVLAASCGEVVNTAPGFPAASGTREGNWGTKACQRAIDFMHTNLRHRIRLQEIASEAGLSPRHLTRLFRQHHGRSVLEHLTELRLAEARRQLRADPERPIKVIAYECGFGQPGYLTRCYRRRYDCAPSEDR